MKGRVVTEGLEQSDVAQLLLQLGDLDKLGNIALLDLARSAQFLSMGKGQSFSVEEQRSRHLYLTEGKIDLFADGKLMQSLVAGTDRTLLPVFRVHTHGLVARCVTPVKLLALDENIVNRYVASIRPIIGTGIEVTDYDDADSEPSIISDIRHIFHHQEVDLPSLPEIVLRINKAINDPKISLQQITMEIQTDPLIAARVIQVANSALYGASQHITSLQDAIGLVGVRALQAIVMNVVMQNLFKPNSKVVHKRTRIWYLHSIRVGSIANILARHIHGFQPDRAFLAGLLHDIGALPLLIQAEHRSNLLQEPELLEKVIHELSGYVGGLLLRQWGFDSELRVVAEQAELWQRRVENADYCDLIQIAQLHCHLVGGNKLMAPPMNELPAFARLQLQDIDPIQIIEEAREEIYEIVRLLA